MILAVISAVLIAAFVILIKFFTRERTHDDVASVIFVTHNDEDCLEYMVRRILYRFPHASVRIIDDGSEDDTAAIGKRLAGENSRVEFSEAAR